VSFIVRHAGKGAIVAANRKFHLHDNLSLSAGSAEASSRPLGATLIVTPAPLTQQWVKELARHSDLNVEVYDGLK
jgi:SNF2 family DNA or RNA helicase